MGFLSSDQEDVEKWIRLFVRVIVMIAAFGLLFFLLRTQFGVQPGFLPFVICGGIAGAVGHAAGIGAIALLGMIWPRAGERRKAASSKKGSAPVGTDRHVC